MKLFFCKAFFTIFVSIEMNSSCFCMFLDAIKHPIFLKNQKKNSIILDLIKNPRYSFKVWIFHDNFILFYFFKCFFCLRNGNLSFRQYISNLNDKKLMYLFSNSSCRVHLYMDSKCTDNIITSVFHLIDSFWKGKRIHVFIPTL